MSDEREARAGAIRKVQIDSARMRVTEWRFPPGGATGWHRHEHDYCVVPLTTGPLLFESKDGSHFVQLQTGKAYAREIGVEHDVINPNPYEFVFIEVELKDPPR